MTKKKILDNNVKHILYKPFKPEELRHLLITSLNIEEGDDDGFANSEGLDF